MACRCDSDVKKPIGHVVDNILNRSSYSDAELLGSLRACTIRHCLGKRERSCRCGCAADGGPPLGPFDYREARRLLSRRNRPGIGLHSPARKEVGEVRGQAKRCIIFICPKKLNWTVY